MRKGSGTKQSNTGNNPVDLVKDQLQQVQNKLTQVVKSIIEKFPPDKPSSIRFREIVEKELGKVPNKGTNAKVTIDSRIITQIGRFDTKLKEKVVPYISHRAGSISGQKKREVSQRKAGLENLRRKIQEQQSRGSTKITFEQYINSQIEKQNATIESFDGLNEQEKKAKILELKASNSQLQEDLQTLLAEKESSINAQLAMDDNFNLKTEFFNELTKYVTPVVTSSTFLSEHKTDEVKQHTKLIETVLGTDITLTRGTQVTATLNTECELGTKLDAIEKEIQKELKLPINLEVAEQTKGLASTETEIEKIQRYLAFDTPSFSDKINQKLPQIKISVTKKLQEQEEKILELERRIEAEAQQNIEEESEAKAQGQQVELVSNQEGLSLEFPAEIKEELAIEKQPPPSKSWGSYNVDDVVESLPTDNQGEIPEIIDAQIKLEKLVTELQKKVVELSQQLLEKDSELESFRSSSIGSLSLKIKELEQKLSKSESERKNLFGSNNDNVSRLSSANEELSKLKLKLKDYEASDVIVLRAEISQKEAEIAKMRVSIQEVNLRNAQLVLQDAESRGEISILQQSLGEAQQQNLLLQSQLLGAQSAQTQDAQPLRQEDSVSSMLDTQRADTSDDSDSDSDWYNEDLSEKIKKSAQILKKKRLEIIAQNKLLLSENKELLQLLNSVGDELKNFEQLITTTDQKVLSLQRELVAINAQNQQLKSNLVESKAGDEAQAKIAKEAQERAELAESKLTEVEALSEVKFEALEAQLAESKAEAKARVEALESELKKARADAEAQVQEFKASAEAKAQALEFELRRVIDEAKAITIDVQEVQANAEAELAKVQAEAKISQEEKARAEAQAQEAQERAEALEAQLAESKVDAEDKAKIAQEAQERAEAQAREALVRAEAAEAQTKIVQEAQERAKLAESKLAEAEAELARVKEAQVRAGWPPPPRTSFSRRRPRPSVKLTREMLEDDRVVKGLTVDGGRARLFARSEQRGRRLLGGRRLKLKPKPVSKPETLSSTTSVLPTASGADATKSSTVSSKSLPVLSIPAKPKITASSLPSMPPNFEKTPPVSNHERSSLDLEPKKPRTTMAPSSITILYSAYKRLEQQENVIKDFLSKIAGGVVSDSYMKNKQIYSQKDILDFFKTKGIEFKSYDQALDIIKGVFAENNAMKNQFARSAVDISFSHIFKDVFLKQAKKALSPKNKITVSR